MTFNEWSRLADDLASAARRIAAEHGLVADQQRRARESDLARLLAEFVFAAPDAPPNDLRRAFAFRLKTVLTGSWRELVVEGRRRINEAASRAAEFLTTTGLPVPLAEVRRVAKLAHKDLELNVRKLLDKELASAMEFVTRASAVPSLARRALLPQALLWNMNAGLWRVSVVPHIRAVVRMLTSRAEARNFAVWLAQEDALTVRPDGSAARMRHHLRDRETLDRESALLNQGRTGNASASWRDMGAHYGSLELYLPVPDALVEEATRVLAERRRAWEARL